MNPTPTGTWGIERRSFLHQINHSVMMQSEKITIATQNTRGLGQGFIGRRKRKEVRTLYQQSTPPTDILLLQETKLPKATCIKQSHFVEFKGGTSLWNEGSFSALTGRFRGGTGIVLTTTMASHITHHGILYPSKAQYVVLNLSLRMQLGIINVYGFSHTRPRAMMWNHLAQVTLPEADWVIAGDFNNIEDTRDKQGCSSKTSISTCKLEAWNKLLTRLGVRDAFHIGGFRRKNSIAFTWTNVHNDDTTIQSKINRIYTPEPITQVGGATEILPTLPNISDHAGVILHFNNTITRKTRHPFFNKGLLKHPESKASLLTT